MKKTLIIIVALTIIFSGCSNAKQSVEKTPDQAVNDMTTEIAASNYSQRTQNLNSEKSQFEKGYYDYKGSINDKMPIHLSIYPLGEEIVGSYFYDTQRKEIQLKGKAGKKDIVLYEYDSTGKNTGKFIGAMTTVDGIEGTWISADNKKKYPFKLSLASIIPGAEYGKRYAVAVSSKSDKEVEDYTSKIQSMVINDDKKQLAEEISFPINVKINGKVTKITDKDDFIKKYDLIFHSKYKEAIRDAFTKYMFVNWQGIMFGEGNYNMWINEADSKLKIIAINN